MQEIEELKKQNQALQQQVRELTIQLDQAHRKLGLAPLIDNQVASINMRMKL